MVILNYGDPQKCPCCEMATLRNGQEQCPVCKQLIVWEDRKKKGKKNERN